MTEEQTPTLQGVLQGAMRAALGNLRQCLPARVDAYDETKRRVTVTPLILEGYTDAEGQRRAEQIPPITNVPVIFPGSGKTRLRWPIAVGDTVLLLFASTSLDRWLVRGGTVDPADDRRHDLNDCIAMPGFSDFAHAGDASVMIEFVGNTVKVGGNSPLATKADIDALAAYIAVHVHPSNGAPPTGPVPSAAGTLITRGA